MRLTDALDSMIYNTRVELLALPDTSRSCLLISKQIKK